MSIRGNLRIIVEDSHLKAALLFEPDPQGREWDESSIQNLLTQRGIEKGIGKDAVSSALKAFSESGDTPAKVPIAEGKPPVPPEVPDYQWKIRPVPEDLKKDGEWVFSKAGDPHIARKRSRRVKTEKQVKKKGKFPFSKASTETVDSWTTEEWEEAIHVDPEVVIRGWAESGDILAEIPAAVHPGSMGESVYGKPIAIPETGRTIFLPGQGIEISQTAIKALHDGFVRLGKNWIEVLPFQYHRWNVLVSRDRATCALDFTPGKKDATPPDPERILQAAEQKEFTRDELLGGEELKKLLVNSIHRSIPLKDYPLTRSVDAFFQIEASEDRLKGLLSVRKGSGKGKPLVLKDVGAAIKKSGFKGMDFDQIKKDLLEFYRSRRTEMNEYVLAEGTPPSAGSDQVLTFHCSFLADEKVQQLKESCVPVDDMPSLQIFAPETVRKMAFVSIGTVAAEITSSEGGEEGVDVYGNKLPGLKGKEPPLSLQENILIKNNEIIANEDGILDVIEAEGQTILRVRPYREASITVEVSPDRMQAFLSLENSSGTAPPLTMDQVNAVLEEHKVLKGIDTEVLSEAILKAKGGGNVDHVKIAEGNSPVLSEDGGQLKFLIDVASGDKVTISANGQADYRAHDEITSVEKDQLIAEIPPVSLPGSEGWDVSGNPVKAAQQKQADVAVGENIRRSEKPDGTIQLFAEKSGELMYDGRNIGVHVFHYVKGNVDMHTGNVRFPGDVQVKGNVERGFYVMAGGEIQVAGIIDGALLSSGGSIQVAGGVVGAKKAVLRAKSSIRAQFAEEATLLSVGDIEIKNNCLRCRVKTNGKLRLYGERGTLIGGKIYVRQGLEVKNLGNEKGTPTMISFGQDYLVADQIEQHEKQIKRLKELITSMDDQMKACEQRGQKQSLEKVRGNKLKYLKMIEKRSLRLFTLRERYEEHFNSKIVVTGTIYPGVIIESHGRFNEIHSARKNVTVSFNQTNGRIEIAESKREE